MCHRVRLVGAARDEVGGEAEHQPRSPRSRTVYDGAVSQVPTPPTTATIPDDGEGCGLSPPKAIATPKHQERDRVADQVSEARMQERRVRAIPASPSAVARMDAGAVEVACGYVDQPPPATSGSTIAAITTKPPVRSRSDGCGLRGVRGHGTERLGALGQAPLQASPSTAARRPGATRDFRPWFPRRRTTSRPGASGGIPNGSDSPCTISTGHLDGLELAQARLLRPARAGAAGRRGRARRSRLVCAAVRQATRAPAERPPATRAPLAPRRAAPLMTASQAASSWVRRRRRLRPATR